MAIYAKKDAVLMCTGCPGAPAKLDAKEARTINLENGTIAVDSDKIIAQPAFVTCMIIPTSPRKCNPKLGEWMNTKSNVKCKGKSLTLFPNTIPCSFGPGLITMSFAGQVRTAERANPAQGGNKHCNWTKCDDKHEFDIKYPGNGIVERRNLKDWAHPSTQIVAFGLESKFQAKPKTAKEIKRASNYPYQKHHVIPAAVIESQVPNIKHNLELLGFDINNEGLNGISLPEDENDIKWHGLQAHRGCHPSYNAKVKKHLDGLEGRCETFCRQDKQGELWEEIIETVQLFRKRIVEFKVQLRTGSKEYQALNKSTKAAKEMAAAIQAAKSHINLFL